MNSEAYELARVTHTAACNVYSKALNDYRAGKMSDADFLAAKAVKKAADEAFDVAFNEEAERADAIEAEAEETARAGHNAEVAKQGNLF